MKSGDTGASSEGYRREESLRKANIKRARAAQHGASKAARNLYAAAAQIYVRKWEKQDG